MRKKAMGIFLAALMVGLTGCGNGNASATTQAAAGTTGGSDTQAETTQAGGGASSDEVITLRFGDTANDENCDAIGNKYFADLVAERTNGRVKVEYYNNGSLGSDKMLAQSVIEGTLDMGKCSCGNFSDFSHATDFTDMPGLFDSLSHVRKVWQSDIRDDIVKQIKDELGVTVVMFDVDGGEPRLIGVSGKEVRVPSDMSGVKIRTTGSQIEIALFKEWGANAITVEFSEMYSALQQNLVSAFYLQSAYIVNNRFEETIDYAVPVNQSWVTSVKILSKDAEERLGEELYNIVLECGKEAEEYKDGLWEDAMVGYYKQIEDAGVKVLELTAEEKAQWDQASANIWDQFVGTTVSQELLDKIQALK
ncbi:TRAP transporter substrate-binding protein [Cuneatibacter sp. NSJ-177]|uniref:TRAP transporter substrate-binding protein n=1 Tax=Cuneatibacter sp. NSJ-177 TaxID=2931401 RepID=UPI001FCF87AE|nr:TRAP transporter substrate-binding protein [Cuneatibacter sp. NSJ-177]MCJ7836703.1 TRAP transporter substrate-binding protein [Cuneatibacter sp. NSJ-177]